MPSPIDLLLDPVSLAVLALYGALITWETVAPARQLPSVRGWKLMGLAAFTAMFFVSSYLPLLWTEQLSQFQLFDLTGLGTWGGALVGVLVYEFGVYVWHRTMHSSNALWRVFHQMHHSAERVDAYGAFWFSPADLVGWTVLYSLALTLVVGITAEATTVVLLVTTLLAVVQHTNVRTPQWLGYIVQRPESHSHHHERGVHARNYSDLPVFDMIFGTFYNPRAFASAAGFYDGASARIIDMLLARDVSIPRPGAAPMARAA
jgi:sterol desaturase/sphingolipid hydroxylase (fatty acid hydroxylase superfamily)